MVFLVVNKNDSCDYFSTDNLEKLISEHFKTELEEGETFKQCKEWFFENNIVFKSNGDEIDEILIGESE